MKFTTRTGSYGDQREESERASPRTTADVATRKKALDAAPRGFSAVIAPSTTHTSAPPRVSPYPIVTSFGARSSAAATIFLGRSFRVQRRQSVRGGVERRQKRG